MTPARFILRSLRYHARGHLAALLGVATAVAVLCGALLVGASVRASLRTLALSRLGNVSDAIRAPGFARADLAAELLAQARVREALAAAAPAIVLEASVAQATSGRRASPVAVYAVDRRYFELQGGVPPVDFEGRGALVSASLAAELRSTKGDALLLRFEQTEDVPASSLFGRRDLGRTLRVTQLAGQAAELALTPRQGASYALYLPLETLQRTLRRPQHANLFLFARRAGSSVAQGELRAALQATAQPFDLGLRVRPLAAGGLALEARSALVSDELASSVGAAARSLDTKAQPLLVGLATDLRAGSRSVPYSLVAGLPEDLIADLPGRPVLRDEEIVVGEWLQRELQVEPGDSLELHYDIWEEQGGVRSATERLRVAASVPREGLAADRELAPEYPGITDKPSLADWDPPFPIDLGRVRPQDERYWEQYRTTPKAFLTLATAQRLFGHRLGRLTSLRLAAQTDAARFETALLRRLEPEAQGLRIEPLREQALAAAQGATDFGEYFLYFSFVLIVGALLLAGLFFRLGVERRLREIGLLRAVGLPASRVQRLFLAEGLGVAFLGSVLGALVASLYAGGLLLGLRTLWLDAVGTRDLRLALTPGPVLGGGVGGFACTLLALVLTLRGLRRASPRALLSGVPEHARPVRPKVTRAMALLAATLGLALLAGAATRQVPPAGAFFGAGALLLAAALLAMRLWFAARRRAPLALQGLRGRLALGFRNACDRPGRSLACVALIACATFLLVSVGSFRHAGQPDVDDRHSGIGGYTLVAESLLALHHDPLRPEGRVALGLEQVPVAAQLTRFRLQPGDDGSCLNLYQPKRPRVLGAPPEFLRAGRFAFAASLAQTPDERANPWLLLADEPGDATVPAIADANSLTYVWHLGLGDVLEVPRAGRDPLRLRFVATLRDSLFQSELIVSEKHFMESFPDVAGYRFFLGSVKASELEGAITALEERLGDYGFDAVPAAERWTAYHRVENAYLGTFQSLGALGLLLGSFGLQAVLLRNALERERELALLRAVGFTARGLASVLIAENLVLAVLGLGCGTAAALLAVAPALVERGALPAGPGVLVLLALVPVIAMLASLGPALRISRRPIVSALRAE